SGQTFGEGPLDGLDPRLHGADPEDPAGGGADLDLVRRQGGAGRGRGDLRRRSPSYAPAAASPPALAEARPRGWRRVPPRSVPGARGEPPGSPRPRSRPAGLDRTKAARRQA